jgi:trehalose/maltose hydrolase-like predicted phosphorylase
MQNGQTAANVAPWWESLKTISGSMADRLSESTAAVVAAKVDKELNRYTATQKQTANDASIDQNRNAASEPIKGKDSDGATLTTSVVEFGGMTAKTSTLKKVSYGAGALLIALISYKLLK